MTLRALIFFMLISINFGYKTFQELIPNGEKVEHPCLIGKLWPGVGHHNVDGAGTRNPFGTEFAANNQNWTAVCNQDSDGDGKTNGEELGDPNCVWVAGAAVPGFKGNITHPGVCEPMNSANCKKLNTFYINCDVINQYECEDYDNDVFNITYRFDRTQVPAVETTYICQRFALPEDNIYHLIGQEALIDNENVMHHILAYGCSDMEEGKYEHPTVCSGMPPKNCSNLIGGWAFGRTGPWCSNSDIGKLIGQGRYKYVFLQYHWNNPQLMKNQYDETAFRLFFTPNLRAKNATSLITGNRNITIPPRTKETVVSGTCSSSCTNHRIKNETVYVYRLAPHMHLLGTGGKVIQKRNGEVLDVWFNKSFAYNSPQTYEFDPPKELKGGDEIYTECKYNSINRENTTLYGDGTQEEMCYMFVSYYPETIKLSHCINGYGVYDSCVYDSWVELGFTLPNSRSNPSTPANRATPLLPSIVSLILLIVFTADVI